MPTIDAPLIDFCGNILRTQAGLIWACPSLGNREAAANITAVADLMQNWAEGMRRSHKRTGTPGSQCDEDAILADLFAGQQEGIYLDIGAGEAMQCSNTWSLYDKRDWNGVLIEPFPEFFLDLGRYRWGDILVWIAAADYTGQVPFFVDGSVSSCLAAWSKQAPERPISMECMNIAEILDHKKLRKYRNGCDLVSLDVEGFESRVLSKFPWDLCKPKVFCVEYRKYCTSDLGADISYQWEHHLLEHGYVLHRTTMLNKIYVTKAAEPDVAATPA